MEGLLRSGTAFWHADPVVAGALGLVLLYLLIRKTKLLLSLLLLAAVHHAAPQPATPGGSP